MYHLLTKAIFCGNILLTFSRYTGLTYADLKSMGQKDPLDAEELKQPQSGLDGRDARGILGVGGDHET